MRGLGSFSARPGEAQRSRLPELFQHLREALNIIEICLHPLEPLQNEVRLVQHAAPVYRESTTNQKTGLHGQGKRALKSE
jgi:hypothetical protein